jgi:hypothetical protein
VSVSINKTAETVEFRNNSNGNFCGVYHYTDQYKSFSEVCIRRVATT